MIPKQFDSIAKADIEALITDAVSEGHTIEYKEQLPGTTDDDKREFLADVSSFANASGGDLIYGICEARDANQKPTGTPGNARGLVGINIDEQLRRMDDMIRSNIDPRIPGVRLKAIEGFPDGPVIVLRIPKSWAAPHMVTFKGSSRFFARISASKHPLDVREIRASFLASDTLAERIRAFRLDRVAKILAGETPVPMEATPKIILHLLPVGAFANPANVDVKAAQMLPTRDLQPMDDPDSQGNRFNFDGYLVYSEFQNPPICYSYVQVFRNGAVEAVWANIAGDEALWIDSIEREFLAGVPRYLRLLQSLGNEPPLFVTIGLVGIKGRVIRIQDGIHNQTFCRPIDRDVLLLPEIAINEEVFKAEDLLRPAFDTIWQSSGWPQSLSYDGTGKRIGSINYLCR